MVFDTHTYTHAVVKRLTAAHQRRLTACRHPLAAKEALMEGLAPVKTDIVLLKWMTGMGLAGVLSLILKTFF